MTRGGRGRSVAVAFAAIALALSACVTVGPAGSPSASTLTPPPRSLPASSGTPATSATPKATPTGKPSATPHGTPSTVPTVEPTEAPTASPGPTDQPSDEPTATPTSTGGTGFHADTPVFADDFSDANSNNWGVGPLNGGAITNAHGKLTISFTGANTFWSWSTFTASSATMRIVGNVDLSPGDGGGGWACGSGPGEFIGGVVNNDHEWVIILIHDSNASVLDRGPLPDGVSDTGPYKLSVECAGTDTGAGRIRLVVDGIEAATHEGPDGPANFDRVAAYAAGGDGFDATFDNVSVFSGDSFGGFPTTDPADAADLLTHVPTDFASDCTSAVPDNATALAQYDCSPAGSVDEAHYLSFTDTASMDAAYDGLVAGQSLDTGSCRDGPHKNDYNIGGVDAGRLSCFKQDGEAIIVWTDIEVNIVSGGGRQDADFSKLFDWWNTEAGPIRNP